MGSQFQSHQESNFLMRRMALTRRPEKDGASLPSRLISARHSCTRSDSPVFIWQALKSGVATSGVGDAVQLAITCPRCDTKPHVDLSHHENAMFPNAFYARRGDSDAIYRAWTTSHGYWPSGRHLLSDIGDRLSDLCTGASCHGSDKRSENGIPPMLDRWLTQEPDNEPLKYGCTV